MIQLMCRARFQKSKQLRQAFCVTKKRKIFGVTRKRTIVGAPYVCGLVKRRVALTTGTISKGNISGTTDKRFKADYLDKLEAKAKKMDISKKGKRLVSDKPVSKSREPKTVNDYRRGKN